MRFEATIVGVAFLLAFAADHADVNANKFNPPYSIVPEMPSFDDLEEYVIKRRAIQIPSQLNGICSLQLQCSSWSKTIIDRLLMKQCSSALIDQLPSTAFCASSCTLGFEPDLSRLSVEGVWKPTYFQVNHYLEVTLGEPVRLNGIRLFGNPERRLYEGVRIGPEFVMDFSLLYSNRTYQNRLVDDVENWIALTSTTGIELVFEGCNVTNYKTGVYHSLTAFNLEHVERVRLAVVRFFVAPAVKWELYGCPMDDWAQIRAIGRQLERRLIRAPTSDSVIQNSAIELHQFKYRSEASLLSQALSQTFLLSADQAHAVHPNYSDKHEKLHKPSLRGGPVLKVNANQRYATHAVNASVIRLCAEIANVPLQEVVVKNDSACGSTIGPIMAAALGITTCDIGSPQLSMHSCREMASVNSVQQTIDLYQAFFENCSKIMSKLDSQY